MASRLAMSPLSAIRRLVLGTTCLALSAGAVVAAQADGNSPDRGLSKSEQGSSSTSDNAERVRLRQLVRGMAIWYGPQDIGRAKRILEEIIPYNSGTDSLHEPEKEVSSKAPRNRGAHPLSQRQGLGSDPETHTRLSVARVFGARPKTAQVEFWAERVKTIRGLGVSPYAKRLLSSRCGQFADVSSMDGAYVKSAPRQCFVLSAIYAARLSSMLASRERPSFLAILDATVRHTEVNDGSILLLLGWYETRYQAIKNRDSVDVIAKSNERLIALARLAVIDKALWKIALVARETGSFLPELKGKSQAEIDRWILTRLRQWATGNSEYRNHVLSAARRALLSGPDPDSNVSDFLEWAQGVPSLHEDETATWAGIIQTVAESTSSKCIHGQTNEEGKK